VSAPSIHGTVPARLRDAKDAAYRDLILDVAEQEFAERGYEATLMKDIAGSAGISLATLYARFEAKMDLYRAVHHRRLGALNQALAAGAVRTGDALTQMLSSMRVYVTFHMTHPTWLRMHLREGNSWSGDEKLRSPEQTDAWNRGQRSMAKTFQRGMDEGLFAQGDPVLLARLTNALHQTVLSRWVEEGMAEGPQAVVERMQALFIRAFCTPERVPALLAAWSRRAS
jgi:TetR/AcrR family transcriptional repressor of mexJK operon